jgi:hypothetical protein
MSCLRYLYLSACSGVQHMCFLGIFFLRLVWPVSLDCPFFITPSVFSDVNMLDGNE